MNLASKTNDIITEKESHTTKLIFYTADPAIDRILLKLTVYVKIDGSHRFLTLSVLFLF